jgi:chemotaxis protein MotB
MKKRWIIYTLSALLLVSCVSNKKFKSAQDEVTLANEKYASLQKICEEDKAFLIAEKNNLETQKAQLNLKIQELTSQNKYLKDNNTQALSQLENLSVISKQQAESIRKSMDNLGAKDDYIQTLQKQISYKDSLNMALVMNLKGAIGNLEDEDINIKVDKGVVYIDISDKLLFKSGSYDVTEKAKRVLGKVATVLKNQPDIEFMIEGHTDNVPYKGNGILVDNWDLSVKRSTTIVRLLQVEYGIPPQKMSAAGRGEYNPLNNNNNPEAKAQNRRTRIVILPQLDQFFKLLEMK